MQFLLAAVNAKYIHSNPAIYSLRASAGKELQPFIALAQYTVNQRMEEILGDLYARRPDVIGFSCYIWNIALIKELLREIPKVLPDTDLWLGGPEVSFEAEQLLAQFPMVRGIMLGEGEETFRELLGFYVSRQRQDKSAEGDGEGQSGNRPEAGGRAEQGLEKIPGLMLPGGATLAREPVDMDQIPFFYACLEKPSGQEAGILGEFENRILYYETGRGCPFRCGYCLSSVDKRVRFRSLDKVRRELQFFLDRKVPQVKLIDRTFNCNRSRAMEIWRYLKEHDNGVTNFHFEIAAELLGGEEIALLQSMRPGQVQLEIGVQTANEETLREIGRSMGGAVGEPGGERADAEEPVPEGARREPPAPGRAQKDSAACIEGVVRALHRGRNIHLHLDLIAGLPLETYESFGNSFNRVYAMRPHQLQLGFLKVLKGTAMWENAERYGMAYQESPPYEVLHTRWISYGEILRLKQVEEMVELYYNTGQFTRTLPWLEEEFVSPFALYEELAAFYRRKGYFVQSPARSRRYHVLLEFAVETAPEREELYRELLTLDYYLREKARSRPSFGRDLTPYREEIRNFYQQEERAPGLPGDYSAYHARQVMNMTHMDVFFYPVWEERNPWRDSADGSGSSGVDGGISGTGPRRAPERRERPGFVLFDYGKRDVLTGNAAVWLTRTFCGRRDGTERN